jgi:hypothetical protein
LWRTVYLLKIPGLARKARVAADWTLDLFLRSDTAQLGLRRECTEELPAREEAAAPEREREVA